MSLYLLDTNTITDFQRGHPAVLRHVQSCAPSDLTVSVISIDESLRGWYTKVRRAKKKDELARAYQQLTETVAFFARLRILSFTEPAIDRYDALRTALRTVGKNDLRIAAIAQENGATVVSANLRDFQQVPGLVVVDWTK